MKNILKSNDLEQLGYCSEADCPDAQLNRAGRNLTRYLIFPSVLGQHLPDQRLALNVFVKSFLKTPIMERLEFLWTIPFCSVLPYIQTFFFLDV